MGGIRNSKLKTDIKIERVRLWSIAIQDKPPFVNLCKRGVDSRRLERYLFRTTPEVTNPPKVAPGSSVGVEHWAHLVSRACVNAR